MISKFPVFDFRIKLLVTEGRHKGAVSGATGEPQILGSSLDANLVLTDAGVRPRHARIRSSRHNFELEALEGAAKVNGDSVELGQRMTAPYPSIIEIGEAKIEVVRSGVSERKLVASLLSAGAGLVIVVTGLVNWYGGVGDRGIMAAGSFDVAGNAVQGPVLPGPEMANAAADALRQHLLSKGIAAIEVKPGAGTVIATGSITPERQAEWQSAEIWFDETFGQKVMLTSDVSVLPAKTVKVPITIQAVWLGDTPYLIDGEGRKFFVGSILKDGWILEKVEEGKVVISKNEQPLILRY